MSLVDAQWVRETMARCNPGTLRTIAAEMDSDGLHPLNGPNADVRRKTIVQCFRWHAEAAGLKSGIYPALAQILEDGVVQTLARLEDM